MATNQESSTADKPSLTTDNTSNLSASTTSNTNNSNNSNQDVNKLDLSPATLEALKTLSTISSTEGIEKLSNCDKLTASLEQIKANKNMNLFEKLDNLRQDFSGFNSQITQMEQSMTDLKKDTSNLVKSLH